jgi:hypothetical protein
MCGVPDFVKIRILAILEDTPSPRQAAEAP